MSDEKEAEKASYQEKIEKEQANFVRIQSEIHELEQRIRDHEERFFKWLPWRVKANELDIRQIEILSYQKSKSREHLQNLGEKLKTL